MTNNFNKARQGSGTREWSDYSFNIGKGCAHNCLYCYARQKAIETGMIKDREDWTTEILWNKKANEMHAKKDGVIMFPTTHDITPFYLQGAISALRNMLEVGNKVLIVSKPHLECIQSLCEELTKFKNNILFRFTIGSLDENLCKFWEPGAPSPMERIQVLQHANSQGYKTSVSMVPMLAGLDGSVQLFEAVEPNVTDGIWVGKINKVRERVDIAPEANRKAVEIIEEQQSDKNIRLLYAKLKDNEKVRWKESIKWIVGK